MVTSVRPTVCCTEALGLGRGSLSCWADAPTGGASSDSTSGVYNRAFFMHVLLETSFARDPLVERGPDPNEAGPPEQRSAPGSRGRALRTAPPGRARGRSR